MYEEFYGLSCRPFAAVPDPGFLFWSAAHEFAFTMLRYGVMTRAPVTVMTGEPGVGKTALLRQLINEQPETTSVAFIPSVQEESGDLLPWILTAFGQFPEGDAPVALMRQLQDFVELTQAEDRAALLVIDEAQNLGTAALEQLRLLTNLNPEERDALQIVLAGQPALRERLSQTDTVKLGQRVTFDFTLGGLQEDEVEKYIERRLSAAGAERQLFTPQTCKLIYESTRGVPRSINIVCDLCLIYGYADSREIIDEELLLEFLFTVRDRGILMPFTQTRASADAIQ